MGIFANGIQRAVRADRLWAEAVRPPKDEHYRDHTYHWECIESKDAFYIGRVFRWEDIRSMAYLIGTKFRSTRTGKVKSITYQETLPGFEEVDDER